MNNVITYTKNRMPELQARPIRPKRRRSNV